MLVLRAFGCAHAQEVCLHALVTGTHDDAVLRGAVRQLAPPEVLALLTYLRKWVERQAGALTRMCHGLCSCDIH